MRDPSDTSVSKTNFPGSCSQTTYRASEATKNRGHQRMKQPPGGTMVVDSQNLFDG